jgi:hypothetical protein
MNEKSGITITHGVGIDLSPMNPHPPDLTSQTSLPDLVPRTSRSLSPDALVREEADCEVAIYGDLAGEARVAEAGGSAVVPVLRVRDVTLQPDAARRAEAASAAVHRLGQPNVGR